MRVGLRVASVVYCLAVCSGALVIQVLGKFTLVVAMAWIGTWYSMYPCISVVGLGKQLQILSDTKFTVAELAQDMPLPLNHIGPRSARLAGAQVGLPKDVLLRLGCPPEAASGTVHGRPIVLWRWMDGSSHGKADIECPKEGLCCALGSAPVVLCPLDRTCLAGVRQER